ncbi:TetR/AcrR family transcriptional regulator [Fodinicola acaciae]|uniref:TetR/AcrR family transcriptional regulator n=1 Tax=Fodinicola acaciae TaxID=2681555 RepID=UPI001C9E37FD|nr:TetR/AcrR family transcriptional regulator [Fodinicola acaciae]
MRLTRAQQQERTRGAVLTAARVEFARHGYADAKIDRIAEQAELTRGAVYSNFPSKRALYLEVLTDLVGGPGEVARSTPPPTEAIGNFARVWLERLPLAGDSRADGHLQLRSLNGVLDDERARTALAQVTELEALMLALALESRVPRRCVRLAGLVLTMLNGSARLADAAPGFGDPFDVTRACEHLAALDLADSWQPAHLPYVEAAQPCDEAFEPPAAVFDEISGRAVGLGADGVIAVLGSERLSATEEVVRAAGPGDEVTVVAVTGDPAETGRLVRLRVRDLTGCLRRVFAPDAWPRFRLILGEDVGVGADATDATETAVRLHRGRIVARAHGRGAGHAAAKVSS